MTDSEFTSEYIRLALEWCRDGVKYQHRGCSRFGCDCTGLLIGIAKEMGLLLNYILRKYPPDWNKHAGAGNQLIEELEKFCIRVPKPQFRPGDFAVMRFGKCPAHCGIIVNNNLKIIHCTRTEGHVTPASLKDSLWSKRWLYLYRPVRSRFII